MVRRGVRDGALQDAHRFHDRDRAGAIVECAVGAVPRVVVAAEDHVLLGFGAAWDDGEGVEHRHFAEEAGLGVDTQHRPLTVLGQPVHEPVRLAAQVEQRGPLVPGAEDLVYTPPFRPLRADDPRRPRRRPALPAGRAARPPCSPRVRATPAAARSRSSVMRRHRLGPGELLQVLPRTATRLRSRDEDELAPHLRQPRLERFGGAGVLQNHHLRFDGPVRGRAPCGGHALQRSHARRDEIDVGDPALPTPPGAVLLLIRLDAPLSVLRQRPVVGAGHGGRSGEARPDRVHHHLAKRVDLRALDALLPDRPDYGVVRGKGLGRRRRGRDECQRAGESDSNRGLHGSLRERIGPVTPDTAPPSRR